METIFDSPRLAACRSRAGSSLLIVLAFVVLLTALILAFFSRSILEEQVSNSSANQVKVDNFALGAVSSTLSDLKAEIEAGSGTPIFPVTGNNYIYYYAPTASTGTSYPTMLPAVTGSASGSAPGATFGANSLASGTFTNLVKVSLHGAKFFGSSSPYSGSVTDPSRAAAISSGSSSDATGTIASGSTDGTSLNGRYVSGTRWNKPLFLAPGTVFPLPDWIYVSRTPGPVTPTPNPVTWNANLISSPSNMTTTTTVLGRYAYAIYDEGGLLDINVAGAPTPLAPAGPLSSLGAYKSAEAMADLTQIPGLTQTIADKIVGWRNNASAAQWQGTSVNTPLTGNASSGYTWSATNGTNYFYNVLFNPTGFLRPVSTGTTTGTLAQSDQFFTSRQQLLQFFNTVLGGGNTVNGALQYLTHFSRSLEQPSYIPDSSRPATASTAYGGNGTGTSTSSSYIAAGTATTTPDNVINPPFLAARVTNQYARNDGSIANVGDPLVKKRFALSRLAWLTCNGPIANDNGTLNPTNDSTIATIITTLENTYGYSPDFLAQGGPTNIYKYFGLSWVSDTRGTVGDSESKWVYNHESATYPTTLALATAAVNPIRTLGSGTYPVVSKNRDPDFFELLKAGTALGSQGKAYQYNASPTATAPADYQQQRDNSNDLQVLQVGANIIDQFQPSSYCARILFTDGLLFPGTVQEIRGVEDLPYIYRVREGKITVTDSNPPQSSLPSTTALTSGGQVAILQEPEIWNPHAWSGSSATDVLPRPTSFRIVALSTDPNRSVTPQAVTPTLSSMGYGGPSTNPTPNTNTPGTPNAAWTNSGSTYNSELDFQIPSGDLYLFREPTLLAKPGVPTNSSLAAGASSLLNTAFPAGYIKSNWPSAQLQSNGVSDNQQYIGFLAGTGPAAWTAKIAVDGISATTPTTATSGGSAEVTSEALTTAINGITYQMQYQTTPTSGIWVTYDEKYMPYQAAWSYNYGSFWTNNNKTFNTYQIAPPYYQDNIIGAEISGLYVDPRSSRFGSSLAGANGQRSSQADQFPANMSRLNIGWASSGQNSSMQTSGSAFTGAISQLALASTRPDSYGGFSFSYYGNPTAFVHTGPSAAGWYPSSTIYSIVLPGMLAQNNPNEAASPTTTLQYVGGTFSEFRAANTGPPPASNPPPDVYGFNQYFADADGVVRRAMAAYVPTTATYPATPQASGLPSGLPTEVATDYSVSPPATNPDVTSRPLIINRPFRSVADQLCLFGNTVEKPGYVDAGKRQRRAARRLLPQ